MKEIATKRRIGRENDGRDRVRSSYLVVECSHTMRHVRLICELKHQKRGKKIEVLFIKLGNSLLNKGEVKMYMR